jgi:hypothetical protein
MGVVRLAGPLKPRTIMPLTPSRTNRPNGENWKWDERKYQVADLIADGKRQCDIAQITGISVKTIEDWMRVPAFCEYIDDLIFETGLAVKRLRIAKAKAMFDSLEQVFYVKAEQLMADPAKEKLKDISEEMRELLKQIATEKEEYVQITKTEVSGVLGTADVGKIAEQLQGMGESEKQDLYRQFEEVADRVIMGYTQGITTTPDKKPNSDSE